MADQDFGFYAAPHLSLDGVRRVGSYASPKRKMDAKPLRADYAAHGEQLLEQLIVALPRIPEAQADPRLQIDGLKRGVLVTLETLAPDTDRKGPSRVPSDLEVQGLAILASTRTANRGERSIVFVPDDAREGLKQRVAEYGARNLGNRQRPYVAQFEKIERILSADTAKLFPLGTDFLQSAPAWWELWTRRIGEVPQSVRARAVAFGLELHPESLTFPETVVLFVHATATALLAFVSRVPGAIEEVRSGLSNIEPFLDLRPDRVSQHEFVDDLAGRIIPARSDAPAICVLDTGIAAAHPLLIDGLSSALALDSAWGTDDHFRAGGHGTGVASLALHGDLEHAMSDRRTLELTHTVESVKLLPPRGETPPPSYGLVTQAAVSLIETTRPDAIRSFCLASCTPTTDPSAPSSWSGAIDQIAAGALPGERESVLHAARAPKRLVLVAAGNVTGALASVVADGAPIADPAQSWNAITIGGYTAKTALWDTGLAPMAAANDISPYSSSSQHLPTDLLPIKPEVLFEAGNMAIDGEGYCDWHPALSLLTAGNNVSAEPLVPFWATSAAVGMAGHFMGRLQAALPGLWPETYRALMVHSARWPEPIRKRLIGRGKGWKTGTKGEKQRLLRQTGFGVPQIDAAIKSAKNDFTMIAQAEIQPYAAGTWPNTAIYNEVHFFDLPWPKIKLQELGDTPVMLRATLSYFVEPNLSGKGATRPEAYRSYGLRFTLKKRAESEEDFRARLSQLEDKEAADEEYAPPDDTEERDPAGSNWLLGSKAVSAGSLHCDIWRGRASQLVDHDAIAVHPAIGWWKTHIGRQRFNDRGRYALLLSITADGEKVDLYSEAAAVLIDKELAVLIS